MLESLGKIQNPLVRSLTAAATVGSVITFASAIAIGTTHSTDDSAHKAGLYSALLGTSCGALFGLVYTARGEQKKYLEAPRRDLANPSTENTQWKDWRNFLVIRKVKESEEITSFYLQPEDRADIPGYQPGQFLTIKLDIPGQPRPVIRTYSLSDYPEPCNYYRLSIKREPAPKGINVPPGLASNFMHDQIHEGSIISAKPPGGKFVLDIHKSLPAVLISNGVGITPMISMAKAATRRNQNRPLWFIHGARDGRFHAFRDEVLAIAQQNPNLTLHFAYSRPREEDQGYYHSTGYVDIDLIQSLVHQEAEYFLCGSPPFMDALRQGLKQAGVPESRVFFEMFTKSSQGIAEKPAVEPSNRKAGGIEVVFAQSSKTLPWQTDSDNLLEFAEASDLNPPYSCRQGICGTCQCKLLAGEVTYQETPTAEVEEGSVVICISRPKSSKVVLDL